MPKDLDYFKKNAVEDYRNVPISVLRYITELEKIVFPQWPSEEISAPAIRVRYSPVDSDKLFIGTVLSETNYSYIVAPDDNLDNTVHWNKKRCKVITTTKR